MTNLKEELWKTLENLRDEQFKQFQWFLKQNDTLEGFLAIVEAQLERADRQDTVDLMVQKYGQPRALERTIKVLEKISRNDLVMNLLSIRTRLKETKTFPLRSEFEKKKAKLGETKAEITLMIQERQRKVWEIKCSAEISRKSAHRQTEHSKQVFTVLLQSVEKSLANLTEAIEERQKTTQRQAEELIQELEKEISELTKGSTEVEQLLGIEDHREFLQSYASRNPPPPTRDCTEVSLQPPSYEPSVWSAVSRLKEEFSKETDKLLAKAKLNRAQQFAVDVTLDPDTANPWLILSDDGKQVHCGDKKQNLPDNPQRFNPAINVLGKQSISSRRFYYEVQVDGKTSWDLGVVQESINRKGSVNAKPENGYWTICLRNSNQYKVSAANLSVKCPPKKVGVFVDYTAGSISFYDVDSAQLLHCFSGCSFTEKLYPMFSPGLHRGENCTPLIISSVNYID
ncbi:E3 ubiquitin-protein ligase TRIM21 [Channa argus]|uniref:E3 ubiquitin-protein ligase TRIM21 n=1 Tax=Channa argus TaxID=215402 RepID=A0A6G1QSP8_CHAAH|nr:E3 ubiquitin-protein ligase TRIM21 [Channa argus]